MTDLYAYTRRRDPTTGDVLFAGNSWIESPSPQAERVLMILRTRDEKVWRAHSDAVNDALLRCWLPPETTGQLLKTDLFDEAPPAIAGVIFLMALEVVAQQGEQSRLILHHQHGRPARGFTGGSGAGGTAGPGDGRILVTGSLYLLADLYAGDCGI